MLQRAAETVSGDDECNDPAVLLACALGSTGCPAKCAEAEKDNNDKNPNNAFNGVIAGDLSVAVSTSTSTVSIPNDGIVKVAELAVKASEDIQLQSIDVTRLGLSENSGIKVWIEKDGRRISSSSSFFGDSKASLTFNNGGYVVKGDETLDLVVSLDKAKVAAGSEFQFKVSNVVSSAKNVTVSPDTTGTFRTAVYSATSITIINSTDTNDYTQNPVVNTPRSYNLSKDTTFSFGEFKVQNDASAKMEKDVMIKSITFKVEGSIENLANFKLLRDSKEISSKYSIDGKSLTFAVNDQLDSGKSATYKVTAEPTNIENAAGDSYTLSIKKAEDIIAEEIGSNATAYRVSVKESYYGAAWWFQDDDWDVVSLGTTKISGGNITLTKDSSLASTVSADWGYSDVVIAKGTMKVNQAVKFDSLKIDLKQINNTAAGTFLANNLAAGVTSVWLNEIVRRAALVIDGKTYQAEITDNKVAASAQALKVASEIYLTKGEHNVELQISLVNRTPDTLTTAVTKLSFDAIAAGSVPSGNYTNGDETQFTPASQIAGTIKVADVNIAKKAINVKKVWPSEDVKFAAGNTDEIIVLAGEITNNEDKALEVNKFVVTPTNVSVTTAGKLWDLTATMDNSTSSNVTVSSTDTTNGVSIDSLTTTINPGQTVRFEIRMIPHASLKANDTFKFTVSVEGKLDGNDTKSSDLNSAKVTATAGATSTIVANTTDNKLIVKPGVSTKVASFNYNVKNDSKDVNSIELIVAGFNASDLDDLTIDFGGSVGAPGLSYRVTDAQHGKHVSSAWNNTILVTFSNVVTLPVNNYKVNVYATFNESAIVKNIAQTKKQIMAVAFDPTADWATETAGTNIAYCDSTDIWNATTWNPCYNGTAGKTVKTLPVNGAVASVSSTEDAAALSFGHWIAKAYPILSVKDKNTTSDNARLDISIVKNNDDANTVTVTKIDGNNATEAASHWHVIQGSDKDLKNVSLDYSNATVIRSSIAVDKVGTTDNMQRSISNISFTVLDDEGNTATYELVDAGSDYASLSL